MSKELTLFDSNSSLAMMLFFFHLQIDWPVRVFICTVLLLQEVQHVGCLTNHRVFWIHLSHLLRVLSDAWHRVLFRFAAFREIHLRQLKNGLIIRGNHFQRELGLEILWR